MKHRWMLLIAREMRKKVSVENRIYVVYQQGYNKILTVAKLACVDDLCYCQNANYSEIIEITFTFFLV